MEPKHKYPRMKLGRKVKLLLRSRTNLPTRSSLYNSVHVQIRMLIKNKIQDLTQDQVWGQVGMLVAWGQVRSK